MQNLSLNRNVVSSAVDESANQIQQILLENLFYFSDTVSLDSTFYILSSSMLLVILAWVSLVIAKFLFTFKIARIVARTHAQWDKILLASGVFNRVAHIAPGIVLLYASDIVLRENSLAWILFNKLPVLYILMVTYLIVSAALNAVEIIYKQSELAKKAPITGFIQVAKLVVVLVVIFLSISLLINKNPIYLLSGLTALAAVLLLIFRDTILGFVSGIQIAANRMFNTGDWIQIEKYAVDGDILEIGLNVVKVQNWDKTISTIPTYALTTDAVKNWRGMMESGGRRIKRCIQIDINSIQFCDHELLETLRSFKLLNTYIGVKVDELKKYHEKEKISETDLLNSRRLTNIGTFRAYIENYLTRHPNINHDLTCMVRQLKPSELGLPIEIYCFSKQQDWVTYEKIQADIFDHIFAIIPLFKLAAYQRVSDSKIAGNLPTAE